MEATKAFDLNPSSIEKSSCEYLLEVRNSLILSIIYWSTFVRINHLLASVKVEA